MTTLGENVKQGFKEAIVSRGKNKGLLKVKCPPINTLGAAVWNAVQNYSNPYKVGFCHLMFMDGERKELYDYIVSCGKIVDLTNLDKDGNVLRELGIF